MNKFNKFNIDKKFIILYKFNKFNFKECILLRRYVFKLYDLDDESRIPYLRKVAGRSFHSACKALCDSMCPSELSDSVYCVESFDGRVQYRVIPAGRLDLINRGRRIEEFES